MILNFHFPAGANDDNKKAKLSYEKALEVYSEENFPGALQLLDRIITDYPRMSYGKKATYLIRIIIQHKLSLKELKELNGKNSVEFFNINPHLIKGVIYQREGKEDKAFAEMIKARASEDSLAITNEALLEIYKKTALLYEKLKQYKKAARMYRKALVLSPKDGDLKKSLKRAEKLINKTGREERYE